MQFLTRYNCFHVPVKGFISKWNHINFSVFGVRNNNVNQAFNDCHYYSKHGIWNDISAPGFKSTLFNIDDLVPVSDLYLAFAEF